METSVGIFLYRFTMEILLAIAVLFVLPSAALSWGAGHNSQADQIWRQLPESFTGWFTDEQRDRFIKAYSHYPDYRGAKNLPEPAGAHFLQVIKEEKFNPDGTVARIFPHFVEELRAGHKENTLMWGGCMVHTMGDKGALNHPDIIWFPTITIGWIGVTYTDGRSIDQVFIPDGEYPRTYFNSKYRSIYDTATADYQGKVIGTDPQTVMRHLIVRDSLRDEEINRRPEVLEAFVQQERLSKTGDEVNRLELAKTLAQVVAPTNREILDTIVTGIFFAQQDPAPSFDFDTAMQETRAELGSRGPSDPQAGEMILFNRYWSDQTEPGALGIIISNRPGAVRRGGCRLGAKHQWTVSLILRTLADQHVPYRCISFEESLINPDFDPVKNPVLLMVATELRDENGMEMKIFDQALIEYVTKGGSVIWIGGQVCSNLARILPPAIVPDRNVNYPVDAIELKEATFVRASDGQQFPVYKQLDTLSWNSFGDCRCLYFEPWEDNVNDEALLHLVTPKRDVVVGVCTRVDDERKAIYLPWFVICPYLLSEETTIGSVVDLRLDEVGRSFLMTALKKLGINPNARSATKPGP